MAKENKWIRKNKNPKIVVVFEGRKGEEEKKEERERYSSFVRPMKETGYLKRLSA